MRKGTKYKEGQNKGGRPPIAISPEQETMITELAGFHCTNEEIASQLGISAEVLTRRFQEAIQKGRLKFCTSLRRLQYRTAIGYWEEKVFNKGKDNEKVERRYIAPCYTMQIWLGKQYMGQRDQIEQNINQSVSEFKIEVMSEEAKRLLESGNFFPAGNGENPILEQPENQP